MAQTNADARLGRRTASGREHGVLMQPGRPLACDQRQYVASVVSASLPDSVVDGEGHAPQLRLRETDVEAHVEVGRQLRIDALECGQGRDGRDLSALHVQVIAAQDVSEEMALQEGVDGRTERDVSARRRPSHQLRLNFGPKLDAALVGRQGGRFASHFVSDASSLPVIEDVDERVEAVQAAREPRIGVQLDENLFDLVDGPASFQPPGQGRAQLRQVAVGREGGDRHEPLLLDAQPVGCHGRSSRGRLLMRAPLHEHRHRQEARRKHPVRSRHIHRVPAVGDPSLLNPRAIPAGSTPSRRFGSRSRPHEHHFLRDLP